ncbi:MAG: TadE/TadG family type IV pilus assembly protein [Acidimicrobiales bacterium]
MQIRVRVARRPRRGERDRATLRERGAAMVEFALISPVFFLLLFGGIEMGLIFRSHLAIEDMSRNAARVASVQRDDPNADRAILQVIVDRTANLQGEVQKVIIYSADTLDSALPSQCINIADQPVSVANVCNSYLGTDIADVAAGTGTLETGLTAAERNQWRNLGIYVELEHRTVTGVFDTITLDSTTIEVVELDL